MEKDLNFMIYSGDPTAFNLLHEQYIHKTLLRIRSYNIIILNFLLKSLREDTIVDELLSTYSIDVAI